jgi:hypothetical protein
MVDNHIDGCPGDRHDGRGGGVAMTSLITLICRAHTNPDPVGPLITLVDGTWAYCDGHGEGSHDWSRIQPTRREDLADLTAMLERRAS